MSPRPSDLSRRRFLTRMAGGSAGLAVLPVLGGAAPSGITALGRGDLGTGAARSLPPAPPAPDEAYWEMVRAQFPLREGVVPMNAANLCPAPRPVVDATMAAMRDLDGDVSFQNRDKFGDALEAAREGVARVLGASPEEIALVRNTSEANNVVVGGLELGTDDEVLLFDQNHPTNAVAWDVRAARYGFTVRRLGVPATVASPDEVVALFRGALSPRTRVLAFSDVSNTTGLRMPTRALCRMARERGVHAHVDGAQTFGALRRDLHDLGCDSYAASAHKWFMGPKEAGVLYVRRERIPEIWPGMVGVGWGDGVEPSAEGARKFETLGQRNDPTLVGMEAAVRFHELLGAEAIEARVLELGTVARQGLTALPGVEPVTPAPPELRAGVVVASIDGADAREVYQRLYGEHGVAGAPTGGLRLSPHVYNTRADVERAVEGVGALLAEMRAGP